MTTTDRTTLGVGTKGWLMLTMPASEYVHAEYHLRRISLFIGAKKVLGVVLGTLLGLFLGVMYIGAVLPASGLLFALILVGAYVLLHREYWKMPVLPQRDFRHAFVSGLVYTVTCAELISIGRDFSWLLAAGLMVVYCFILPMIRARQFLRDAVKHHDTI